MKHIPRKRFGQNFLNDHRIIQEILHSIHPSPNDCIIEIGPGLGAITQPLLQKLHRLIAIEIDRDLANSLVNLPMAKEKLQLISADALSIDYSQFGNRLRIVGNLPYNISTPLLLHLLQYHQHIEDMHFMLQKEVVDRLCAVPDTKSFGRLSILVQYFCEVEKLLEVPPESFFPAPKVDSAIVRLKPYSISPWEPVNLRNLQDLVAKAFGMRRKTLANNLKGVITSAELNTMEIDPGKRPEQISIAEYIKITNKVKI